jgi:hypothetical protein
MRLTKISVAVFFLILLLSFPGQVYSAEWNSSVCGSRSGSDRTIGLSAPAYKSLSAFQLTDFAARSSFVKTSNATKEAMVGPLLVMALNNSANKTHQSMAFAILLNNINRDQTVLPEVRTRITGCVNSEAGSFGNLTLWQEHQVVFIDAEGNSTLRKAALVDTFLDSLPAEKSHPAVFLFIPRNTEFGGRYSPDSSLVEIALDPAKIGGAGFILSTLAHETAHYYDNKEFTDEESAMRDQLWAASQKDDSGNFVSAYGSKNKYEDMATVFEQYYSHSRYSIESITSKALNNKYEQGSLLLEKFQIPVKFYSHPITTSDGKIVEGTYVFSRLGGKETRSEVAMTSLEIDGKVYSVPDFDTQYSSQEFGQVN